MNSFEIEGEEVIDGEAKPFGNGAHVTVPKDWRRASVKVVRTSEPWTPADGLDLTLAREPGSRDRYGGYVRLRESRIEELGLEPGDPVELEATGTAAASVRRGDRNDDEDVVRAPPEFRLTIGAEPGDAVSVRPASPREARELVFAVADEDGDEELDADGADEVTPGELREFFHGHPLVVDQLVSVPSERGFVRFGWHPIPFRVVETTPDGVVTVGDETTVRLAD